MIFFISFLAEKPTNAFTFNLICARNQTFGLKKIRRWLCRLLVTIKISSRQKRRIKEFQWLKETRNYCVIGNREHENSWPFILLLGCVWNRSFSRKMFFMFGCQPKWGKITSHFRAESFSITTISTLNFISLF